MNDGELGPTSNASAGTMIEQHHTNPMRGPNRFKLGVFSANCDGGLTMSLAPERWPCDWDDIAAMCLIADALGWSSSFRSPNGAAIRARRTSTASRSRP